MALNTFHLNQRSESSKDLPHKLLGSTVVDSCYDRIELYYIWIYAVKVNTLFPIRKILKTNTLNKHTTRIDDSH